jgi:hypothetical protein
MRKFIFENENYTEEELDTIDSIENDPSRGIYNCTSKKLFIKYKDVIIKTLLQEIKDMVTSDFYSDDSTEVAVIMIDKMLNLISRVENFRLNWPELAIIKKSLIPLANKAHQIYDNYHNNYDGEDAEDDDAVYDD